MSLESVIHNLVSALGGCDFSLEDKPYILGDDGLACLKDLKRWLQYYDEKYGSWDVRRILADTNFVEGDLCPILAMWDPSNMEDKVKWRLSLACVELLVVLTWPLEVDKLNANVESFEQLPHLRLAQSSYKKSLLNYPKGNILFTAIAVSFPSMSIPISERSERDEGIIRLVLYFIRNIAIIDEETTRSETIIAFKKAEILDLIVSIAGSIGNEFVSQDVIILEIIFYLFRGLNPEKLVLPQKYHKNTPLDDLSNLLKSEVDIKRKNSKTAITRHNRFGTLISVVTSDNRRLTVASQKAVLRDSENCLSKIDTAKRWKMRKSKISMQDDIDKPVLITYEAIVIISAFINEFLNSSFNSLFLAILQNLEREEARISQENHIHFLYCIGYFMHFLRLRICSKGSDDSLDCEDYGLVASMLEQRALIMVYKLMREAFDLKKMWKELHAGMECFKQILLIINCMTTSSEEYQEIANNMQNNIYYEEYNLDLIISVTQSFGFLNTCTELVHILLKMLEKYSNTKTHMYVRVRQRQSKKTETDLHQSDIFESDNEDSQGKAKLVLKEKPFEFFKFEKKFVNDRCIDTFRTFLGYYKELTPEQIKRVITFFHRIFVKQKAEIYMFRLDICELLNRMINDDVNFSKRNPSRHEVEKFVKFYMKRLTCVISQSPALYIELLFHKMHDTIYYLQHGHDDVQITKPLRLSARFEVKPGMNFEQQVSVVVGVLLDENKSDELDWLKIKLSDCINERKAWELEKESRDLLKDDFENDTLSLPPPFVVAFETEQHKKRCFKNGKFRLLLSLCGFVEEIKPSDIIPTLIIPSEISSTILSRNLSLVKKYTDNPPIFDNGKTAIDFLRRKNNSINRYDMSNESDTFISDDSNESISSFKKIKKRDKRLLNNDELEARRKKRKKIEQERINFIKSSKYVINSDDDKDDAAFFEAERILREKMRLNISVAYNKEKELKKMNENLDSDQEISDIDINKLEKDISSESNDLSKSNSPVKRNTINNEKLFIDEYSSSDSDNEIDYLLQENPKEILPTFHKNIQIKKPRKKSRHILLEIAIILVGGPSSGTRFRPLSLDIPKPLFPIGGKPMIWHHLVALSKVEIIHEVLLIGFYDESVFSGFLKDAKDQFSSFSIKYLREYQSLGTAGGLYLFRDVILRHSPKMIFVLHSDLCCSFPLQNMLKMHLEKNAVGTLLGTKVSSDVTSNFGCIVWDSSTGEVIHYVEKPETHISSTINCGVYIFDGSVFGQIKESIQLKNEQNKEISNPFFQPDERLRIEQDILSPLSQTKRLFVYETNDFWCQIKTAGSSVPANALYLLHAQKNSDKELVFRENGPEIVPPVYIDPSAIVNSSAKLGPNVSIGPKVKIHSGVRISNAIILDGAEIKDNACILHSIISRKSRVGQWARVEGTPTLPLQHNTTALQNGVKVQSATVVANDVIIHDEVLVQNCIVLPHKEIKKGVVGEVRFLALLGLLSCNSDENVYDILRFKSSIILRLTKIYLLYTTNMLLGSKIVALFQYLSEYPLLIILRLEVMIPLDT
ncbi:hypothetical protein PORY_000451 [Pneumocystis oryctolagi]|uniref:Uncharacterized protein n=1 Tax=Pneumocystis oryctolagi TaxID=42067 RepID=A0ACB7CFR5_9ASCO|nr:hypothetical protein PORY_000451 [Pneumocystis oryctolagi]